MDNSDSSGTKNWIIPRYLWTLCKCVIVINGTQQVLLNNHFKSKKKKSKCISFDKHKRPPIIPWYLWTLSKCVIVINGNKKVFVTFNFKSKKKKKSKCISFDKHKRQTIAAITNLWQSHLEVSDVQHYNTPVRVCTTVYTKVHVHSKCSYMYDGGITSVFDQVLNRI